MSQIGSLPRFRTALVALSAALVVACGGGSATSPTSPATAGPASPPTGGTVIDPANLCALLGPEDFASAGIQGAAAPSVNSDGPGSAYCVYAGTSGATGGIEFDAFVDDDPEAVFDTITGEGGPALEPIDVAGADEALGSDGTAGQADAFATVVARKGRLVFTISAPGGDGMAATLAGLAAQVVQRGSGLTG